MRSDVIPGSVFPDYQLPDHTGTLRRLSEIQGDDPLILTLSRGHTARKNISNIWSLPSSIRAQEARRLLRACGLSPAP